MTQTTSGKSNATSKRVVVANLKKELKHMQEFAAITVAENGAFSRAVIANVADIEHLKSVIRALSDEV